MKINIISIIGILIVFLLVYNYIQTSQVYVNEPIFHSEKLAEDLKITQITDYHGNTKVNSKKLLKEVKEFDPHIITLTGDMIDGSTNDLEPTLKLIKNLSHINDEIFFVIGNHELRNTKGDEFLLKLEEIGVRVLNNEGSIINIHGDNINILGISYNASKLDYKNTIKNANKNNYTILLSHCPNRAVSYMTGIEDLTLSGHTHGGQVRLPFIGAIVAPDQGLFPRYDKGIFEFQETILYIDSGLGNSIAPIRFLNRIQITNMTIKN